MSAKLVEVKGPRDRLSHQQRFWLAHMANNAMQVGSGTGVEPRLEIIRACPEFSPSVGSARRGLAHIAGVRIERLAPA
jgi:hypothetical protein